MLNIGCTISPSATNRKELFDSIDNIEILSEVIDSAKKEFDVEVVRLWCHDTETGDPTQILQTVKDSEINSWYYPDGNKFIPIPYDSVPLAQFAKIWKTNPLQL